jgi:hypothetical protein
MSSSAVWCEFLSKRRILPPISCLQGRIIQAVGPGAWHVPLTISCAFLSHWDPQYDDVENDQIRYDRILTAVAKELVSLGTLSQQTFLKIIEWKAARVKGKLSTNYAEYSTAIKAAYHANGIATKVQVLVQLDGIGVPVASTILHFMFPNEIPINDYRTVEILHAAGLVNHLSPDQKRLPQFVAAILLIRSRCPQFTLRQIDRALFAYHKLMFEPTRTGKPPRRKCSA